jgi:hypothetical protein
VVNLRLQVSTWMRNAAAAASGIPQANPGNKQPENSRPATAAPEGE